MANLIKEVRLIFAENGTDPKTGKLLNSYKYWEAKLYDDGTWSAEWGRVGCENPDSGTWNESDKTLDSVVRSKMKKGYTEQKTIGEGVTAQQNGGTTVKNSDLHTIARSQLLKTSSPVLDRLIKRFVDANVHKITSSTQITYNSTTGLFSTPLGIVTPDGLTEARDLLADLAPFVRKAKFGTEADAILCKYLRIIPQNLGMRRFTTQTVIPDDNAIQKQNDLIDSLESSYQAMTSASTPKDGMAKPVEQVFRVDLDVLSNVAERQRLNAFFENSKKHMHGYDNVRVREFFKVNIHDMTSRFLSADPKITEVFHGSSMANCLSILKSGLKINPPSTAAIAGKMWGNGLYGAINSTKSLGYTFNRWGQGGVGDAGWLFICNFAMGKVDYPRHTCHRPSSGCDSIWATASNTGLANDELIVYSENRVKIKYLLECK